MLAPAGASSGGSPGHALPGWLSGEMLSLELWRGALPGDCAFAEDALPEDALPGSALPGAGTNLRIVGHDAHADRRRLGPLSLLMIAPLLQ